MIEYTLEDADVLFQQRIEDAFSETVKCLERITIRSAIFLPFANESLAFSRSGVLAHRIESRFIDLYFDRYMKMAPVFVSRASLKRMKANKVYFANRYVPDSIAKSSAFYKEFLKPQDQFFILLSKLVAYEKALGGLAIHRSESQGPFLDEEIEQIGRLTPHIARAFHHSLSKSGEIHVTTFHYERAQTLSKAQRRIASMVCKGKSNREIAETLQIREQSVKDHLCRIYRKLGVHSRTQLMAVLTGLGLD